MQGHIRHNEYVPFLFFGDTPFKHMNLKEIN